MSLEQDTTQLKQLFEAQPFVPPDTSDVIMKDKVAILKNEEENRLRKEKKLKEADEPEEPVSDPFVPATPEEVEARLTPQQLQYRREREERKRAEVERERVRTEQKNAVMVRLEGIAAGLGFDVAPERSGGDGTWMPPKVEVKREDGAQIILSVPKWQPVIGNALDPNKVKVELDYIPDYEDVEGDPDFKARHIKFTLDEKPYPINVSLKKTDDRLKADIKRRIIGELDPAIARMKVRVSQDITTRQAMVNQAREAAEAFGSENRWQDGINPWRDAIQEYFSESNSGIKSINYKVRADGETSNLNLILKNPTAIEVLKFLKKYAVRVKKKEK